MARSGVALVLVLVAVVSVVMESGDAAVIKSTNQPTARPSTSLPKKETAKTSPSATAKTTTSSSTQKTSPAATGASNKAQTVAQKKPATTTIKPTTTTTSPLSDFEADELIPFNGHLSS